MKHTFECDNCERQIETHCFDTSNSIVHYYTPPNPYNPRCYQGGDDGAHNVAGAHRLRLSLQGMYQSIDFRLVLGGKSNEAYGVVK